MASSRRGKKPTLRTGSPYLRRIASLPERMEHDYHPFTVPALRNGIDLELQTTVTFFVGENGSGKSTLLEAIAQICGFSLEGGSRDHYRESVAERSELAQALRLSWFPKVTEGFFMRAESFYNFATYIERVSDLKSYGGRSLHHQSHGESFLALFQNRFEQGLYILDEPEAALSPHRQLAFLKIIHDLASPGHAQFLIATHSPILLAYPGATLYGFSAEGIREMNYRDTEHYQITKDFLNAPERYINYLFSEDDEDE